MLIVEDAEDDALLLATELKRRGMRIDWRRVDSAAGMSRALADDEWDIIICDHDMPFFDAFAAQQVLKASGKDLPFIIYSGYLTEQQASSALHSGAHDAIEKGNIARLLPVIERELKNAAARHAVRQADTRIRELAYYDGLSSLPNQNLFAAQVTEWILAAERRHEACGTIIHLDMDRFLRINASFGYEAGNEILRQIAKRLTALMPADGLLARLSGDSFAIFLPGEHDREWLSAFAENLRQCFDAPFTHGALELFVTASIGLARLQEDGNEVHGLLMNAETAMSHAKRQGGNAWRLYRRDMNADSGERVAFEADLRHAVERGELFLLYQPCVEARNGRTVGVEALVRWQHPQRGLIPPDRFIPLADESGIINAIGLWVLQQACRQARRWRDAGLDLFVAVNVSAVQFAQPRLLETVRQVLADSGLEARRLQLEITESMLMQDAESAIGMLRALRNMGVRISVDDFGTGYSSLAYLKRFPIDVLKIDRSFVRGLPAAEADAAIVRAIIALAHALKLTTVAEGVETVEQVRLLRDEGCDRFQGYHFGRPMAADDLQRRLNAGPLERQ